MNTINDTLKAIVKKIKTDSRYLHDAERLLDLKIKFIRDNCASVLDIGKSTRKRYSWFKKDQITTLDINQYDDYPDIQGDLCNLPQTHSESFDAVICMAILEHVYDPQKAAATLYRILRPNGFLLGYVPFLYRYHAPVDLTYQDFYRYTRDGIAYLLRDFSLVTIYPYRGLFSTMANLLMPWKFIVERFSGQYINRLLDSIGLTLHRNKVDHLQVSGYFIWAQK